MKKNLPAESAGKWFFRHIVTICSAMDGERVVGLLDVEHVPAVFSPRFLIAARIGGALFAVTDR